MALSMEVTMSRIPSGSDPYGLLNAPAEKGIGLDVTTAEPLDVLLVVSADSGVA